MRRVADWLGRSFIVLGALTLLFVVYQLWGTNLVQAREQRGLKSDFREQLEATRSDRPEPPPGPATTTTTTRPVLKPPPLGEALGIMEIPAIGLEAALVEGTGREELKKGPGHYPHSPLPGHAGNVAVAGHRTTYGAPFLDTDELEPGDEIRITTLEGTFLYRVTEQLVTHPKDVSVIDVTGDNRLTLTTCHPRYSARERLITVAELLGEPLESGPTIGPEPDELVGEDLGAGPGEETARDVPATLDAGEAAGWRAVDRRTLVWTLALLGVGALWWAGFRTRPRWYTWGAGALPFAIVLFFFFGEIETLLPANY